MNKKIISMVAAIAVGGTLLTTAAAAVMAETSGYDTYKAALKNLTSIKSVTADADITVTDNGNAVLNADGTIKYNRTNNTSSAAGEIKYSTKDVKAEMYKETDKTVTKTSDSNVYLVMTRNVENYAGKLQKKEANKVKDASLQQSFEGIIDAYVGNRSNDFAITTNSDGSRNVTVKLDENQITPLDNAIVSFAVQAAGRQGLRSSDNTIASEIQSIIPELTSDITVKSVDAAAAVSKDNVIQNQTVNVTLAGKDQQGKVHNIVITLKVSLTNINSTTPDKIDLTGKKTQTMDTESFGRRHR